ncbi:DUF434 domain-containing protein [Methanobacterium sp. ACI-7]|uniref:DUF434 domain-containing protein n=1 Tax=unclassified Methanobacterium TaxID=2627676 RepID=UPI0039C27F5E
MQLRENKLKEAAYDLRFLLNRNYRKKSALTFVANKYVLSRSERNYLARSVFSKPVSNSRKNKIIDLPQIEDRFLLVDGYNVLITTESICREDYASLVLCDDGLIRDINAVFGKYKFNEYTEISLNSILKLVQEYDPHVIFFFDKKVSWSGKLAKLTEEIILSMDLQGETVLSENVDFDIVKEGMAKNGIIATSDGIIIDKVENVIDIPSVFLKNLNQMV